MYKIRNDNREINVDPEEIFRKYTLILQIN